MPAHSLPMLRALSTLLFLGYTCVLGGCAPADSTQSNAQPADAAAPTDVSSAMTALPSLTPTPSARPEPAFETPPHPVSIRALAEREPAGRDLTFGTVQSRTDAYTRYTISYKSDDLSISGILNLPHGEGPFPVLILNHGYIDTSVYTNGRGLKREQDYLARRGYAVLHPDYRNHASSDKDPFSEAQLRLGYSIDVLNAVEAVRTSGIPQLDGSRVGMLGHSMGGGIALNLLVAKPALVRGVVLFAPVSTDAAANYERWLSRRPEVAKAVAELYGTPQENPEFWRNASARTYLSDVAVPVLLHHGTADKDVPVEWSRTLEADLRAAGKDITYHEYPGEPHEFSATWGTVMQRTVEFFDRTVKGALPAN